jgi:hypothetical protein
MALQKDFIGGLFHLYGWHCEKIKNYNEIHTSIFSQIFTISFVEMEFFHKVICKNGKAHVQGSKQIIHFT